VTIQQRQRVAQATQRIEHGGARRGALCFDDLQRFAIRRLGARLVLAAELRIAEQGQRVREH
jgi:hypothetical protein